MPSAKLALLMVGLIAGCGRAPPDRSADGSHPAFDATWVPLPCRDEPLRRPPVRLERVPTTDWPCRDRAFACEEDYLGLADWLQTLSATTTDLVACWQELEGQHLRGTPEHDRHPIPPRAQTARDADAVEADLRRALRLPELWAAVGTDPPIARFGPATTQRGYDEEEVLITVGRLGTMHGRLLLPQTPGPWPAVVVLPGHEESSEHHRDRRGGAELPRHGVAALILDTRAYDGRGGAEHRAALALLCTGHSLLAVRVVEAISALDVLASDPRMCRTRLGAVGHSGGGGVARLVACLRADVAALVVATHTDYQTMLERYEEGVLIGPRMLSDDYDPEVAALAHEVGRLEALDIPALQADYDEIWGDPQAADAEAGATLSGVEWLAATLGARPVGDDRP